VFRQRVATPRQRFLRKALTTCGFSLIFVAKSF
jgi:hypothetical protein